MSAEFKIRASRFLIKAAPKPLLRFGGAIHQQPFIHDALRCEAEAVLMPHPAQQEGDFKFSGLLGIFRIQAKRLHVKRLARLQRRCRFGNDGAHKVQCKKQGRFAAGIGAIDNGTAQYVGNTRNAGRSQMGVGQLLFLGRNEANDDLITN